MTELKRGNGWLQSLFQEETMEEKVIEFRIHVPKIHLRPRVWKWALAGLLVLALAENPATESITLTTYYPAPAGAYNNMVTIGNTWLARDPLPSGGQSFVEIGSNQAVTNPNTKLAVMNGAVGIGTTSPGQGAAMTDGLTINANNSTAFTLQQSGVNAFAINPNNNGTADLYDSASGWRQDIHLGYGDVLLNPSGSGYTSIGNYPTGPAGGNSYLHVNGQNCYSMGQGSDNATCSGGYYATWTPGIYVETGPPWNGTGWSHTRYQWAILNPYTGSWVDAGIDCNGQWNAILLYVSFFSGMGSSGGAQWEDICSMSSIWNGDNDWWCCAK